jgi:acyl carrier protein
MNQTEFFRYLSEYTGIPVRGITLNTRLDTDLSLNSMDFVTMICEIEERYNIHIDDTEFNEVFSSTYTVGELIDIIENNK